MKENVFDTFLPVTMKLQITEEVSDLGYLYVKLL